MDHMRAFNNALVTRDCVLDIPVEEKNAKVLFENSCVTLLKQKRTVMGDYLEPKEMCSSGTCKILHFETSGEVHIIIRNQNFNMLCCDHVISSDMVVNSTAAKTGSYTSHTTLWPAQDVDGGCLLMHLISKPNSAFENPFLTAIGSAQRIVADNLILQQQKINEQKKPEESRDNVDERCVSTPSVCSGSTLHSDVQSESTLTDTDQSVYSDFDDDISDNSDSDTPLINKLKKQRAQLENKLSVLGNLIYSLEENGEDNVRTSVQKQSKQNKQTSELINKLSNELVDTVSEVKKLKCITEQQSSEIKELNKCVQELKCQDDKTKGVGQNEVQNLRSLLDKQLNDIKMLTDSVQELNEQINNTEGNVEVNKQSESLTDEVVNKLDEEDVTVQKDELLIKSIVDLKEVLAAMSIRMDDINKKIKVPLTKINIESVHIGSSLYNGIIKIWENELQFYDVPKSDWAQIVALCALPVVWLTQLPQIENSGIVLPWDIFVRSLTQSFPHHRLNWPN